MTGGAFDVAAFTAAFSEWVEACWFDERPVAAHRLEAVLGFPPDIALQGLLPPLGRLVEALAPAGQAEVAAALAHHLVLTPDPAREALIADLLRAAAAPLSIRGTLLMHHDAEEVVRTALECTSLLAQAMAERHGVVPSSVLSNL